jgi:hypothetical protein
MAKLSTGTEAEDVLRANGKIEPPRFPEVQPNSFLLNGVSLEVTPLEPIAPTFL